MATFKVKQLTSKEVDTHPVAFFPEYDVGGDIPTGGGLELTFDDGTVIVFSVSEWGSCYAKSPGEPDAN